MVLLVHPDQERLVVVVVDASADRPVSAGVRGLQETVALLEQEVVIDQLLLGFLVHALRMRVDELKLKFVKLIARSRGSQKLRNVKPTSSG